MRNVPVGMVLVTCLGCVASEQLEELGSVEQSVTVERTRSPAGWAETISLAGEIDRTNPFFQRVGPNARTCETCHEARDGWTFSPGSAQARFTASNGTAPIFLPHDGSVNPAADHSTLEQRRVLYDLLLRRGLIQTLEVVEALEGGEIEFDVIEVDDPYGSSTPAEFRRFRRPNSIANEGLTQTVSWNGVDMARHPLLKLASNIAARVHSQRTTDLDDATQEAMTNFMENLIFAQAEDLVAGRLDIDGARGGVAVLASETFVEGANDPADPLAFNRQVFTLYSAWIGRGGTTQEAARAAIARGEVLFNTREFDISSVAGLNDELGQPVIRGTCSTCHAVPNVGNHPVFRPMDIGTASEHRTGAAELPLLTVRAKNNGAIRRVTDLGRALKTGRWNDIAKFSVPRLRGVNARAPHFHNGSAINLREVIAFYDRRFAINFSASEINDLAAFLRAL